MCVASSIFVQRRLATTKAGRGKEEERNVLSDLSDFESSSDNQTDFERNYSEKGSLESESDESMEFDTEFFISQFKNIYEKSNVTLSDFVFSFMVLCRSINLPVSSINKMLKFIKAILPKGNLVPKTYTKLIRILDLKCKKQFELGNICLKQNEKPV
ncbi:unnamed protein product [Brachionus calyciflorus]|uniref:Uncharacterized protein n=1 Tax=Brachionus calyciflorus TaxID=104777 RepID=A0A814KES1_9BILA|nr:unnamed protein product [Brachionus calyciflorus]